MTKSPSYKHFILTHFNLKLFEEGERCFIVDKNNKSTQQDEWMEERIRLFDKYCFPSVQKQSNKNFKWLILFDEDTPEKYKDIFKTYHNRCSNLEAIYLPPCSREELYKKVSPVLKTFLKEDNEYIITTNLDNDDTLNQDFVEKTQQQFISCPKETLYRFIYGYQYFEDINYMMKMRYPHNHFLTLSSKIIPNTDIKPVTHYKHASAHRILPYVDIKTNPMWIEIVHGTNVNNSLRVKFKIVYIPIIFKKNIYRKFNVDFPLTVINNIKRTVISLPLMVLRHLFKKFFIKRNK